MISVMRMNGMELYVNAELVEYIEATPDTVLTLTTGRKFVLKDSVQEVVDKIIEYRKTIGTKLIYHITPEMGANPESYGE